LAAQQPKLELGLEIGLDNVKSGRLARLQSKLVEFLRDGLPQTALEDKFTRLVSGQSEKCLPLRAQIFAADKNEGTDERGFLMVVDSAAPLNLTEITNLEEVEAIEGKDNAFTLGGAALHQFSPGGGGSRLIAGNIFGDRPAESPLFLGKHLPQPRRLKKSLLNKLRSAPYYVMADVGVMVPAADATAAREMAALVGPYGLLVGATLTEIGGRPALDVIWGLQPGRGLLGMFLPRKPENAKVLGSLPFDPSFMLLANLGREGRLGLITALRAALAGGGRQPGLKPMLEFLDLWSGEAQFMSQLPDPAAAPLAGIRPGRRAARHNPVFSIVLKLEDDTEADAIRTLKRLIPALAGVNPAAMPFAKKKNGVHAVRLGQAQLLMQATNGLAILVMGVTEDDCMDVITGVHEEYPVHTTPTKVRSIKAPLKVFINQGNLARIAHQRPQIPDHIAARGRLHTQAYLFGYELTMEIAKLLFTDGVVYSVSWNKSCLRMRLQF
jgi:hypothetical protein